MVGSPSSFFAIALVAGSLTGQQAVGNSPLLSPGPQSMHVVGHVDDHDVTVDELDRRSLGALSRVTVHLGEQRARSYKWVVEQRALEALARAAGRDLKTFLRERFQAQAAPPASAANVRWSSWAAQRAVLVQQALAKTAHDRLIPEALLGQALSNAVVGMINGQPVIVDELDALAGHGGFEDRLDAFRIAKLHFEEHAVDLLRKREAERIGVGVKELEELELAKAPPITDIDIRSLMQRAPEYAAGPYGYERAKDALRRTQRLEMREALDQRLHAAARVEFWFPEPAEAPISVDVPFPRVVGELEATHTIVAFHRTGCEWCPEGTRLLQQIRQRFGSTVRLVSTDAFPREDLASYLGALALHCANEQGRWWELLLRFDGPVANDPEKMKKQVSEAGLKIAEFEQCVATDRYLPDIFENILVAERLGLDENWMELFVDGKRIVGLKDAGEVMRQIQDRISNQ